MGRRYQNRRYRKQSGSQSQYRSRRRDEPDAQDGPTAVQVLKLLSLGVIAILRRLFGAAPSALTGRTSRSAPGARTSAPLRITPGEVDLAGAPLSSSQHRRSLPPPLIPRVLHRSAVAG